jgi:hypothetical protein
MFRPSVCVCVHCTAHLQNVLSIAMETRLFVARGRNVRHDKEAACATSIDSPSGLLVSDIFV